MFRISVVLMRLKKRIFGNITAMTVMFIGTLLLVFSLNVIFEIRRQYGALLNSAADTIYTVSSRNVPAEPRTHFITENQLARLHEFENLRVNASINFNIMTFAGRSHSENGEEITDKYTLIFSDSVSEICAEKEFAEVLPRLNEKNTVNFYDVDFDRVNVSRIFDDGEEYVHSCVLPLGMYWETAQPSGFSAFTLTVAGESSDAYRSISRLTEILSENAEYEFWVGNEFYDFLSKASYAEQALSKITFFLC